MGSGFSSMELNHHNFICDELRLLYVNNEKNDGNRLSRTYTDRNRLTIKLNQTIGLDQINLDELQTFLIQTRLVW